MTTFDLIAPIPGTPAVQTPKPDDALEKGIAEDVRKDAAIAAEVRPRLALNAFLTVFTSGAACCGKPIRARPRSLYFALITRGTRIANDRVVSDCTAEPLTATSVIQHEGVRGDA